MSAGTAGNRVGAPMGIQDRDYYRDDEPTWWAGTADARVSYALMALVGAVFVLQVLGTNPARGRPDAVLAGGAFDSDALLRGELWRLVTPYLVHGRDALLLVALVLWALYYFGRRAEAALGPPAYATLVVLSSLSVSLVKLAAAEFAGFEAGLATYGSGPVLTAVLVAYALLYPREKVFLVVTMPGPLLAAVVLALEFLGEFGGGFAASGKLGHALGAAFGFVFVKGYAPAARALGLDRLVRSSSRHRKTPLKLYPAARESDRDAATDQTAREILGTYTRQAPSEAPAEGRAVAVDEQFEAKLDQVLEKVSRSGRDSLTGEEQGVLRRASEIYKQRRGT